MDESIGPSPVTGDFNLFESVMSEFKQRVKKEPAFDEKAIRQSSQDKRCDDQQGSAANGVTEYKNYYRKVRSISNDAAEHYHTLPPQKPRAWSGNIVNEATHKPMVPPVKPNRRKASFNSVPSMKEIRNNNALPANGRGLNSELQEIIETTFSENIPKSSYNPYELTSGDEFESTKNTNALTHNEFGTGIGMTPRGSMDSATDDYYQITKSRSYTGEHSYNTDGNAYNRPVSRSVLSEPRNFPDIAVECASLHSNFSDDDSTAQDWMSNNEEQAPDAMSITSLASADVSIDGKQSGRVNHAKAKAKLLKKQVAMQKDRIGAAASNASERLKKFKMNRKQSMKTSQGKKEHNYRSEENSNSFAQAISNISSPIKARYFKNDDPYSSISPTKSLPPVRHGSLTSSLGHNSNECYNRQKPLKSGYLKKQGGVMKTWNERWFVLKGDQLHYYKDVDGKFIGSLSLVGASITTHPVRINDSNRNVFEIVSGNQDSYMLSANSQIEMEEWVKMIRRVILSPFGGGIFGQTLDETMRYDRRTLDSSSAGTESTVSGTRRLQAPIIVENCVEFIRSNGGLDEEGLFRLPGHANEVKDLQDAYDMGERPVFPRSTDVHTVASLLKGYLRELPEPVIPFERYDFLLSAAKLSQVDNNNKTTEAGKCEDEEVMKIIRDQLGLLPQPNFDLLQYLCRFLDEVQQHSEYNKMDTSNLAMVFGPTIMRPKHDNPQSMISETTHVQRIMFLFLSNQKELFPDNENTAILNPHGIAIGGLSHSADAGIGTLTSTASPLGTLGQQHATDDSGTGSLVPTPENTNKRAPPIPMVPPPKPTKPRRNVSETFQSSNNEEQRKSLYDNVAASAHSRSDSSLPGMRAATRSTRDWRKSNESGGFDNESTASATTATTGQGSYYINNRSTPSVQSSASNRRSSRSSTNAVAGSVGSPGSCHSSPGDDDTRNRGLVRANRRPKPTRPIKLLGIDRTDEESNTESVSTEDQTFSTLSSPRSSVGNEQTTNYNQDKVERLSSSANTTRPVAARRSDNNAKVNRASMDSMSEGALSASLAPTVPARPQRQMRRDDGSRSSSENQSLKTKFPSNTENERVQNKFASLSHQTLSTPTSVSEQSSYNDLEDQIKMLKDELLKQRHEHEKRSQMLEDHYIMKMRSASVLTPFTSVSDHLAPSAGESTVESQFNVSTAGPQSPTLSSNQRLSTESQMEIKYREEMKRHAITKIRLRNSERALEQAEERNKQLQKEIENFLEAYGSVPTQNYS